MTEYLRPDTDSAAGNWTNESGGTTLYPALDETSASDTDYAKSGLNPANDILRLRLSNPTGPLSSPVTIQFRYKKEIANSTVMNLKARLVQGANTEIASWTYNDVPATYTNASEILTSPQLSLITDFTDLFLEFIANPPGGLTLVSTTFVYGGTASGLMEGTVDIGMPSDDRMIVVAFTAQNGSPDYRAIVNGVQLTRRVGEPNYSSHVYSIMMPTGTGSVPYSIGLSAIGSAYADKGAVIHVVKGVESDVPKQVATTAAASSAAGTDISVQAGDLLIAAAINYVTDWTLGASTETLTQHRFTDASNNRVGGAERIVAADNSAFHVGNDALLAVATWRGGAPVDPFARLFIASEKGGWWEFGDKSTLYQTTDTSTPITTHGQTVGRTSDKSGRNNHLIQATSGARPWYQAWGKGRIGKASAWLTSSIDLSAGPAVTLILGVEENDAGTSTILQLNDGTDTPTTPGLEIQWVYSGHVWTMLGGNAGTVRWRADNVFTPTTSHQKLVLVIQADFSKPNVTELTLWINGRIVGGWDQVAENTNANWGTRVLSVLARNAGEFSSPDVWHMHGAVLVNRILTEGERVGAANKMAQITGLQMKPDMMPDPVNVNVRTSGTRQTGVWGGVSVGDGTQDVLLIVTTQLANHNTPVTSFSVATNLGTTIIGRKIAETIQSSFNTVTLLQAIIPAGVTTVDMTIGYDFDPFTDTRANVAVIPTSRLGSLLPTSSASGMASGASVSVDLNTRAGDLIYAVGAGNYVDGTEVADIVSGDGETFTRPVSNTYFGQGMFLSDKKAYNVKANANNTVTFEVPGKSRNLSLVAASWGGLPWTPLALGSKLLAYFDPKLSSVAGTTTVTHVRNLYEPNSGVIQIYQPGSGPVFDENAFGSGIPGFVFNAASLQWMPITGITGLGNVLGVATVATVNSASTDSARLVTFKETSAVNNDFSNSPSAVLLLRYQSNPDVVAYRDAAWKAGGNPGAYSTRFRVISEFDGTNHTMRLNGTERPVVASAGALGPTGEIRIGVGYNSEWFDGKVGPIVLWKDALTLSERLQLDAWLETW